MKKLLSFRLKIDENIIGQFQLARIECQNGNEHLINEDIKNNFHQANTTHTHTSKTLSEQKNSSYSLKIVYFFVVVTVVTEICRNKNAFNYNLIIKRVEWCRIISRFSFLSKRVFGRCYFLVFLQFLTIQKEMRSTNNNNNNNKPG